MTDTPTGYDIVAEVYDPLSGTWRRFSRTKRKPFAADDLPTAIVRMKDELSGRITAMRVAGVKPPEYQFGFINALHSTANNSAGNHSGLLQVLTRPHGSVTGSEPPKAFKWLVNRTLSEELHSYIYKEPWPLIRLADPPIELLPDDLSLR